MKKIFLFIPVILISISFQAQQSPDTGELQVFPEDNPWNRDISGYEVHPNSDNFIDSIGAGKYLHPDFGTEWMGAPIGIPYIVVHNGEPEIEVHYTDFGAESDPGPFPIPLNAPVEGGAASGGDRHVIAVDVDNKMLYELYYAFPQTSSWNAASGAKYDLTSNALRPAGWTSADAAGLPIFPGLVRYEEVYVKQEINHALRFTVSSTQKAYIWPARHYASSDTSKNLPPMGLRLRLKAGFDISGFSDPVKVILTALKKYGMMVADNGSDWFISGAPDERWNDDVLGELKTITGSNFEVVRTVDDNGDPVYPVTSAFDIVDNSGGTGVVSAYPNPFREKITFSFHLPESGYVKLAVIDLQGRIVVTIVERKLPEGEHRIQLTRGYLTGGLYLYLFNTGNIQETGKVVLTD